jgi:hypothetical protein
MTASIVQIIGKKCQFTALDRPKPRPLGHFSDNGTLSKPKLPPAKLDRKTAILSGLFHPIEFRTQFLRGIESQFKN